MKGPQQGKAGQPKAAPRLIVMHHPTVLTKGGLPMRCPVARLHQARGQLPNALALQRPRPLLHHQHLTPVVEHKGAHTHLAGGRGSSGGGSAGSGRGARQAAQQHALQD